MKVFICNHSINHFLVCLNSAKLPYKKDYNLYTIPTINLSNVHLAVLQAISALREHPTKDRFRLKYILDSYRYYANKAIENKYSQRFIYNYIKFYKNTLQYNIHKKHKILWGLKLQALTYIYLVYKILQSRHPLYSYFLLITNGTTLPLDFS